ncbi:MAG: PDZ domain-containing protein [Planctomycetota bacterium]|jgi:hypothetical protein
MNALLGILLLLTPVACQSAQEAPAAGAQVHQKSAQPGYSQMVVIGDEGTLVLFLRGPDEVTAILDDAVVPAERIVRDGDRLRILSPEGETLFDVGVASRGVGIALSAGPGRYSVSIPDAGDLWAEQADARITTSRKLIGVTTTPVDAGLAAQLDVDPEQAFVINQVTEGMPAEQAGVRPWDVVVKIDGEGPGTVERLRSALSDKEEGETVRLSILRKGETVELDVGFTQSGGVSMVRSTDDVARYALDRARSGETLRVRTALDNAFEKREQEVADLHYQLEKARARLEASVVELRDAEEAARRADENDRGVDDAQLKALRTAVERAQNDVASAAELVQASRLGAGFLDLGDDGGRALFLPPAFSGPAAVGRSAEEDKRLAQMEERLERLERMLSEFIESEKGR